MSLSLDEIKRHMLPYEGSVPHMYLDTVGRVTVGIGNLLPNVRSAQALPFVARGTATQATSTEIAAEFRLISKQLKGQPHRHYQQYARLELADADIDALFRSRVSIFELELRKSYPRYDMFPDSARLALLDMAFNLGSAGLKHRWPNLNKAIDEQNWSGAAEHCIRPQAQARRNESTVALFASAAQASVPADVLVAERATPSDDVTGRKA